MGLHKVAWGQVLLRYICILVCCYKQFDVCMYTACQGICTNIETSLGSLLSFYFMNFFLYFFCHLAHIVDNFPLTVRTFQKGSVGPLLCVWFACTSLTHTGVGDCKSVYLIGLALTQYTAEPLF